MGVDSQHILPRYSSIRSGPVVLLGREVFLIAMIIDDIPPRREISSAAKAVRARTGSI